MNSAATLRYSWQVLALFALASGVAALWPGAPAAVGTAAHIAAAQSACLACCFAAARSHTEHRLGWLAMAFAGAVNVLVSGAWFVVSYTDLQSAPDENSLVWTGLAATGMFAVFAALMGFRKSTPMAKLSRACDALIVTGAIVIALWGIDRFLNWFAQPPSPNGSVIDLDNLDNLIMVFAVVSVFVASCSMIKVHKTWRTPNTWPALGWALAAPATLVLLVLVRLDVLAHDGPLGLLHSAGFLATVFTVNRGALHTSPPPPQQRRNELLVPHSAMALGVVFTAVHWAVSGTTPGVFSLLLAVMMILVVLRNHITHRDNVKLVETLEERERLLTFRAYHDELTGLDNRGTFFAILTAQLDSGTPARLSVVYLDLDGFKGINDSYGHRVGDHLLHVVSIRLRESCPGALSVARLAGDEFAILLQPGADPEDSAKTIVANICAVVNYDDVRVHISASVGVAVWQAEDADVTAEELLARADQAVLAVKQAGRNDYRVVRSQDAPTPISDRTLAVALRNALDNNEVHAHLQPIVRLSTRQLVGFEALARWQYNQWQVPPTRFIDVAENAGLLSALTGRIMSSVATQLAEWNQQEPHNALQVGINIGGYSLRDNRLLESSQQILKESAVRPEQMYVELTETIPIEDLEQAAAALGSLQGHGIQVALDDFGTGYNSISALLRLPISTVKIDRSMVQGIEHDDHRFQVVSSMVDLAHRLNMRVIAEGIETRRQEDVLMGLGVDYGQGLLFGAAQPGHTWAEYITGVKTLDIRDTMSSDNHLL